MSTAAKPNGRGPRVPLVNPVEQVPRPAEVPPATSTQLMEAILRVQALVPKLYTNQDGQVGGRAYRYADLGAVVEAALPLLVEEQLVWVTFPTADEHGQPALRYRITHLPSGQSDGDVMPLMCAKPDPQGQGSALTYSRRYALCAVLNITVGDDDGQGASALAPPVDRYAEAEAAHAARENPDRTQTEPRPNQPTARPPQPSERRITANQRTKLLIPRAQKAGLTDGEFANVILTAEGEPTRTWSSVEHASQTLDRLLDQLPARLKDAVLEGIDKAQVAKLAGSGQR